MWLLHGFSFFNLKEWYVPKPFGQGTVGNPMTSQILAWLHPTLCKHLCWCAEPFRSYFTGQGSLIYQAEPNSVKCHLLLGFDRITTHCVGSLFAWDDAHAFDMTWLVCLAVCYGKHPSETCHLCPVLVTTISPVMRALQRLMSFSDVTMCYLLLTTVGLHFTFWYAAICLSVFCLLLSHLASLPPSRFLFHSPNIRGLSCTGWDFHEEYNWHLYPLHMSKLNVSSTEE